MWRVPAASESLSHAPEAYMTRWQTAHNMLRKKLVLNIASKPPCSLPLSRFKIYLKSLPSATPTYHVFQR